MSIKSELTKTASYLRNARKAILGRGGEISPTAGLKDLGNAIFNIPVDSALAYQTDDSIAYKKTVPSGALDFAQVSKVGGMSYKSKNLVDIGTVTFEAYKEFDVRLEAGKTYYISTRITSNDTDKTVNQIDMVFEDNTHYYIAFSRDTRKKQQWTPSKNVIGMVLFAGNNYPLSAGDAATWEDVMICEEDTDVYEPYFAGLRHTKVTEMKSEGANLIPFPFRGTMGAGYTTTNNGITFTVLDDGRVMGNGTATANARLSLVKGFALPKGVVKISGGVTVDGVESKAYVVVTAGLNGSWVAERTSIGVGKFDLTAYEYDSNDIYLLVLNGTTLNNAIFEPMVSVYQEATLPYKPYKAEPLHTLIIPTSLQAIDGYGVGINADCYNYVDFEKRQFVKRVGTVDLGTISWGLVGNRFKGSTVGAKYYDNNTSVALCEKYDNYPFSTLYSNAGKEGFAGVSIDKDGVCQIVDKSFSTAKEFKTAMSGVLLYYELAEPEVTDISEYLDNLIKVESGGLLTAVNEHGNAVPTTINYILETAGV